MKATQLLHNLGQSIWLDNITRDLLDSGTLQRYIDELSVTGPERSYAVTSVFVTNRVFLRDHRGLCVDLSCSESTIYVRTNVLTLTIRINMLSL
jgi:hypothetical protein